MRLQEIGRKHRRDEPRRDQREHHFRRDGEAELLEILAGDIADEAHRREDRDDGQADRDDRKADFSRGIHRRLIGRLAHADMADDIFDLDNGVIDENAGRQRDGEQAHEIKREAEQGSWTQKAGNDRQRQSRSRR